MNTVEKLAKSWWVIFSLIMFLNGFGFIYIGTKHNNSNWIIEGLIYEIPWFFYFIYFAIYGANTPVINFIMAFVFLLYFISIVRSFWVAIKLWDVYDNFDKYAHNPVELIEPNKPKQEAGPISQGAACCFCIAVIFFIFTLLAI